MKNNTIKSLKAKITEFEDRPFKEILEAVWPILTTFYKDHIDRFESGKTALLFEGSGWENEAENYRQELEASLSALIKDCKDKLLNKHLHQCQENLKERMKTFMQE